MRPPANIDAFRDPDDNGRLDDPIPSSNALLPMLIILAGFVAMFIGIYTLLT